MSKNVPFHFINTMKQALSDIFDKQKHADRVIDKYVRANPNWKPEDRKLFYDSIYEVVRNKYRYEFAAESEDYLALSAAAQLMKGNKCLPHAGLQPIDTQKFKQRWAEIKVDHLKYSIPEWLYSLLKNEVKASDLNHFLDSLNETPITYLRVNTLKIESEKLIEKLKTDKIKAVVPKTAGFTTTNCLQVVEGKNIFASGAYKEGFFEMQDFGSQQIAPLLQVEPGMNVVDACCGSGGKSLQLAAIMKNSGKLLSMDVVDNKLKDLKIRAVKAGAKIIDTKLITNEKILQPLQNKFDRVLLDVPCSGSGVLKRNPEIKWNLNEENLSQLIQTQKQILLNYSKMVVKGGRVVYATCSLLTEENEKQIEAFLNTESGKKFKLEKQIRIWPHLNKCDGFYAAVLIRES